MTGFRRAPCAKRIGFGISMASVQISQHFRKNKTAAKKNWTLFLWLQGARKHIFCTFSMIWATFCTHQNHCYLCVLFSIQPQSTNFEQNLTRPLHFIGFTFEVGGAYRLQI